MSVVAGCPEPGFPVQPRAAAALARVREIAAEIDAHRAAIHVLALERSDLVRLARTGLTLAEVGAVLGISGPGVAKLQRRH